MAAAGALGGIAVLFIIAIWGLALAMMILSIIFIIKVPKFLEGIEKQLQLSNSLRAEQMHKEALKDADPSDSF